MAAGGIYDQLAGGFHRYAVDSRWQVPHFEKMLYDNAQLALAYLAGWQLTGRKEFAAIAREILDYVGREMTHPEGAFFSATDADSRDTHGALHEGEFYTWTPAELEAALGVRDGRWLCALFDVTAEGNFESGRSVLWRPRLLEEVAREFGTSATELQRVRQSCRPLLLAARARRTPPFLDDKILTSWNGLMISAYARAGFALAEPGYTVRAEAAARFVLDHMREAGRLKRSWREGTCVIAGLLDDYTYFIAGLLDLFESTGQPGWLAQAGELQQVVGQDFADAEAGGYFLTSKSHEKLLVRTRPMFDGAEPAANAIAASNLLRLGHLSGRKDYLDKARSTLDAWAAMPDLPLSACCRMLVALESELSPPVEIVITAPDAAAAGPLLAELRARYLPNKLVVLACDPATRSQTAALVPLLSDKTTFTGVSAFVCRDRVCSLPSAEPAALRRELDQTA